MRLTWTQAFFSAALLLAIAHASAQDEANGSKFVAVDTSHLMGSPDTPAPLGIERPFKHLKFTRPVEITHAGDGTNRLFVVEQNGRIQVFPNEQDAKGAKVFLDLREVVRREHNEEGLLGLAFHPQYRENGQFFVFYSVTPSGSRISRFRVSEENPSVADRASEEVLLEYRKPHGNHNGGSMKFGPDGFLYIGIGDGGAADDPHGNAQNLQTLLGKILRIDVDREDPGKKYAIPKDNPFIARDGKEADNARGEIWAYGLRNVWRLSFDRKTGDLWAADVGQNHHEEVNLITRGGNYGWNFREGKHPRDPDNPRTAIGKFIEPVIDYPRIEGKSITGGLVYRGKRLPSLVGAYLYADFMSGNIWALRRDEQIVTENPKIARTSLLISAFGEDEAGDVYLTAIDGNIYRLRENSEHAAASNFPRTLTETKLFASVKDHEPAAGLIPYEVNVPLWSDGAEKSRFLALPKNASVVFHEQEKWEFPVGTVIVKTFLLNTDKEDPAKTRRLETRLWLQNPRGWEGYTYLWNDEQTEAHLLADWPFEKDFEIKTKEGTKKQTWYFPSRSDCNACHTRNVGFVLGWNTRQLNRLHDFAGKQENQLQAFSRLGIFTEKLPKPHGELEAYPDWKRKDGTIPVLARAYLDANCAMCHSPGGPGMAGGALADLHFHLPRSEAFPQPKGGAKSPWIVPGDPARSALVQRMTTRGTKQQMPPLATKLVDPEAEPIIRQYIEELPTKE